VELLICPIRNQIKDIFFVPTAHTHSMIIPKIFYKEKAEKRQTKHTNEKAQSSPNNNE